MTVSTPSNKVVWVGDGITKSWPVSFRFDSPDHLRLVLTVDGRDVPVAADQWQGTVNANGVGGTVVYPKSGAALAKGRVLTIIRAVPLVQDTDLTNQQGLYLDEIERVDDRTVMMVQDMRERLDRTVTASVSHDAAVDLTLPPPQAGAGIGWSKDGKSLVNDPADFAGTVAAAKAAAAAAKASETKAAASEANAQTSETKAKESADAAAKSATAAAQSATTAKTEADRAHDRAGSAEAIHAALYPALGPVERIRRDLLGQVAQMRYLRGIFHGDTSIPPSLEAELDDLRATIARIGGYDDFTGGYGSPSSP